MRAADPKHYVRGQYEGFRDVKDVPPDSHHRDLRRGRARGRQLALGRRALLHPRRQVHAGEVERGQCRLQAAAAARRRRRQAAGTEPADDPDRARSPAPASASSRSRPARRPSSPPTWRSCSRRCPGEDPEPYERLLGDAIAGNHQLFTRQDAIEETWRVVQPLLDEPGPVHPYEPGTWGPKRGREAGPRAPPIGRNPGCRATKSLARC